MNKENNKELQFAIHQMETAALNFGQRFIKDSNVRLDYISTLKAHQLTAFVILS